MQPSFFSRLKNLTRFLFLSPAQSRYLHKVKRSSLFDAQFYTAINPHLNWLFQRLPARHFVVFGEISNLRPNPDFSPGAYRHLNADIAVLNMPAFLHYISHGHAEGRLTKELPPLEETAQFTVGALRATNQTRPPADYAMVVHVYYHDLWPDFVAKLDTLDIEFDLFVTVTDRGDDSDTLITQIKRDFPNAYVVRMPNHGRDIFPFVHVINSGLLDPYKAVCKFHTKKSPHRQDGDKWRDHLINGILPGAGTGDLVKRFLADRDAVFLVADGQFYNDTKWWGSNIQTTNHLLRRVEVRIDPDHLSFPAGSIYWVKPLILSMIKGLQLCQDTFEPEYNQVDGTLAHAFERAIGYLAKAGGKTVRQVSELANITLPKPLPRPRFTSAFYLPQFHPTVENNAWWGKGFTEWTSTVQAKPNFPGHSQPQLPGDLGFYDLRLPQTMGDQWALAQNAGIDAFCVYHYWFSGKRVLQAPIDNLMDTPDIPFNFYLCWANESWRRNWDGLSGEILLDQKYEHGFEQKLAADAARYMADTRYMRVDGTRPRFVIYRPDDMPDPVANVARLRAAWRDLGIGEVELGAVLFHIEGENPVADDLFDFWVEMPPHGLVGSKDYLFGGPDGNKLGMDPRAGFEGLIYDYAAVAKNSLTKSYTKQLPANTITGIMPSWDNTARRGAKAHIAYGANPLIFNTWLEQLCQHRLETSYRGELFVNAWNEWAEKAVLEPSQQYGLTYLNVLKDRI